MHYTFASRTDPGRLRANNEDALLVDEARGLAVLADGMGGHNAGEVAAGMAVASIGTSMGRWLDARRPDGQGLPRLGPDAGISGREGPAWHATHRLPAVAVMQAMAASVAGANQAIFEAAQAHAGYRGMGTTLVLAVFIGGRLFLGHIGDSRAYRWRGGQFEQLTRDHSLLQEQLDAGLITPAQAVLSTHRNLVTRALGIEPAVALETHEHTVLPGDCHLLCSDGLTDMVPDAEIAEILSQPWPPARLAAALVARANERGGRDNISVLLAQAAPGDPPLHADAHAHEPN